MLSLILAPKNEICKYCVDDSVTNFLSLSVISKSCPSSSLGCLLLVDGQHELYAKLIVEQCIELRFELVAGIVN